MIFFLKAFLLGFLRMISSLESSLSSSELDGVRTFFFFFLDLLLLDFLDFELLLVWILSPSVFSHVSGGYQNFEMSGFE
jgi:hypothetical protein